ncbi:MAG: bifunctional hydroxymethylpyrimidine kinase/phosphomethylpyrimidine kinase [Planctomycetes bacterium]|nr:bifunctional hydroxymethylpyrimidine kinase/phosphomethylpyrimidine kinase [Planctomycetota bacterium]
MARSPSPQVALTIAGSDSSGGAGIQADLKTFSALGVYGASAIAALTAQNTREVRAVHDVPADFLRLQLELVFGDLDVAATKVGMLSRSEVILATARGLTEHRARNVVLDPVMVSKGGARLLAPEAVRTLIEALVPLATVLTPNLPEAAELLGCSEAEVASQPSRTCERLLGLGARSVVLKGGHAGGRHSEDLFFDGTVWERLPAVRVLTDNTHGTGCTFSAAVAAALARGCSPLEAVREAKAYVTAAIEAGARWRLGHGHGPVHHFHAWWK